MSDHVDGPRTMADPSIDLTDIFAFTSPENPENTVVVVNLFPGAGQTAWFSNAAYYSAKLKRVRIDGTGKNAAFSTIGKEICFRFKFNRLLAMEKFECMLDLGQIRFLLAGITSQHLRVDRT